MKSIQIRSYFWSVFSCIRNEYGDLLRKSSHSVQMQENTDQYGVISGPYFPIFGLNMEIYYSVRIQEHTDQK